MNQIKHLDLTIKRLGKPCCQSPMQLSHVDNDLIANFVEDEERILYQNSYSKIKQRIDQGNEPLSFELAGPRDRIFFNPQDVTAAIVNCGGLCPGLNDVIRGLVLSLHHHYGVRKIFGIRFGFKGMVEGSEVPPIPLTPEIVEDIPSRGGTFLGSSRGPQSVEAMVDFLEKRGINVLFTIGGDGTQRGAADLVNEIQKRNLLISVVGIPKTIDNDIFLVEKSFGFETAYTVATEVMQSAHAEAEGAFNGITVVKLMGRHSGYLTAMATVASGDVNFTLIPEVPFDMDPPHGFLSALEKRILERHHAVIAVAEGAGQDLLENDPSRQKTDASGNVKLADIGGYLCDRIKGYFTEKGIHAEVRYIDPSYIVRSLRATPSDRMFCIRLAHDAVHAAMSGRTGMIVGYWNSSFTHIPIEASVSQKKRLDPEEDLWLSVLETTGQPNRMVNT